MVLDLSIKTVAGFWQRGHHILEIWLTETLSKQLKEKILYLRIRSDEIRMQILTILCVCVCVCVFKYNFLIWRKG